MSDIPTISAWKKHQKPVDETAFTPWADKGWKAWNGQSPEVDVCIFVQSLVTMTQPKLIIETGVGQGYMTRSIMPLLGDGQRMISYESDDGWRDRMWSLPFWTDNRFVVSLSADPTPGGEELSTADLCVFDSDFPFRLGEVELWHEFAKPGSVAVIHDTGEQHDESTFHSVIHSLIVDLGMVGFFLHNPRGGFVAVKP